MKNQLILANNDKSLSNYLAYVYKIKMLTEAEEQSLAKDWVETKNQESAQRLIISHLPLVVKIAYSYKNYGQPIIDLISEGNIGLIKAVQKFDPYKGFRLATYAMWWINAYITEYILNSWSLVKSGSILARKKLFFSLRKLKKQLGINNADIPEDKLKIISSKLKLSKEDVTSVNNMIEHKDLYLDAPLYNSGDSSNSTFGNFITDTSNNPEEEFAEKQEKSNIKELANKALDILTPRERLIIEKRFLAEKPLSLNAIGEELNLSRERVRQIEKKSLEKAKNYILSLN